MNAFHLEIVSPEGIVYTDDVEEVVLPTQNGEITVLAHHVPLFTKLGSGEVRIIKGGKTTSVALLGGFLEVGKSRATIISDYAVRAESIEEARAKEAKERAEKLLSEKHENEDFTLIEKDLAKSILELKVAEKRRRRTRV